MTKQNMDVFILSDITNYGPIEEECHPYLPLAFFNLKN